MDAPRDLRGASRAHLMLGNSITDVVHYYIGGMRIGFDDICYKPITQKELNATLI